MVQLLIRRGLSFIPLLLGISIITFVVIHLAPGGPTDRVTDLNPKASLQAKAKMMELYGLDRPLHVQYADWVWRLVRLDFGNSYMDGEAVSTKIARRIPVTLFIAVLSLIFILIITIPLGIIGALMKDSLTDKIITLFVFTGFAMPSFWLALLLMRWFGVQLHILPISGLTSLDYEYLSFSGKILDLAHHLVLPVFVSAFTGLAAMSRYMRSSMLEVLHQDYITTAWSKGLPGYVVIFKHAFRNALIPIVTLLGLWVGTLLGGSIIIEKLFSIPGIGRLFFDSAMSRDYPVIMGILMMGAILTLIGNFLADLACYWVDPRIRLERMR